MNCCYGRKVIENLLLFIIIDSYVCIYSDLMVIGDQFDINIIDLIGNNEFLVLKILLVLQRNGKIKEKFDISINIYGYQIIILLPVATIIIERVFFVVHIVKSRLRNRMGYKWMNDSLVAYIEKDIFNNIDNETIRMQFKI